MLLFRSLVIGLIAGCVVLLIGLQPRYVVVRPHAVARAHAPRPIHASTTANATLVDVAVAVSPSSVASLVKLDVGEHVEEVGDIHVDSDVEAGAEIAAQWHGHDSFVDLGVAGPSGHRRVLVLIH